MYLKFMEFQSQMRLCRDIFSDGTQVKYIPSESFGNLAVEGLDQVAGGAISPVEKIERRLAAVAWVGIPPSRPQPYLPEF